VPTHLPSIAIVLLTAAGAALLTTGEERRQAPQRASAPFPPAFEVATIKPNRSGSRGRSLGYPPNRFVAVNMPLRFLIGNAYGDTLSVRQDMIVGGPSWLDSERFDVEATASSTSAGAGATPPDVMARKMMLRTLLAERFALRLNTETHERAFYALVVAKADGTRGTRLKPSTGEECVSGASSGDAASLPACGPGARPLGETGGYFVTMTELAETIGQFLDRPVLDKTGLSGRFTFDVHFTPPPPVTPIPGAPPDPPADPDAPSIFTAVQEQLGLKLDPQRGPIEVLVVNGVERPTPN